MASYGSCSRTDSLVTRRALTILTDEPLEKVATVADHFLQVKGEVEGPRLAALTSPPPPEAASGEIASLTAPVATLTATVARLEASLKGGTGMPIRVFHF